MSAAGLLATLLWAKSTFGAVRDSSVGIEMAVTREGQPLPSAVLAELTSVGLSEPAGGPATAGVLPPLSLDPSFGTTYINGDLFILFLL